MATPRRAAAVAAAALVSRSSPASGSSPGSSEDAPRPGARKVRETPETEHRPEPAGNDCRARDCSAVGRPQGLGRAPNKIFLKVGDCITPVSRAPPARREWRHSIIKTFFLFLCAEPIGRCSLLALSAPLFLSAPQEKAKVDWRDVEAKAKREAMWLLEYRRQQVCAA